MNLKQARQKYKLLTETFLEEIFEIEEADELLKRQMQAKKNSKAVADSKKSNPDIAELNAIIKKHREKAYEEKDFEMDANKYTVKQVQTMVKNYKDDVDEEIKETITKKKDLEGDYNEQIKQYKQQVALIEVLLEKRLNV